MTSETRDYLSNWMPLIRWPPSVTGFYSPEAGIYLNGNSLGAMPLAAAARANRVPLQAF